MIKLLTDAKNTNFLRLWLAQVISQFGDRVNQMALVGLIAERAGISTAHLTRIMIFTILPVFVIQPFAGVLIDRWDRKTTLFVCDLARGLLVLFIPIVFIRWEAILPIYIIVFLVFSFSRFHVPAKMSIIPDIVEEEHLITANSLVTSTGMIASVLGLGLGGLIIEKMGAKNGFVLDALTFFLSGAIIFTIIPKKKIGISKDVIFEKGKEIVAKIKMTFWQEFIAGFKYLLKHKEIRFIVYMFFILLAAVGAIYVISIVFIQEAFGSKTMHLGSVAVSLCVGLFLGVLFYGRWGKKEHWDTTIFSCLSAGGVILIAFAAVVHAYPVIWFAMALALCLGMVVGPIFIASYTMVHLLCDDEMRGKIFSALEIVIHLAFLLAMLASSWAARFVPKVSILVGVGAIVIVTGLIGFLKTRWGRIAYNKGSAA
ncbi:MAG TPA: MFS transporter [Candidatus Omnitrophota bacterium]|nr:MFS transporter [Candidatus Omnitrophota bacterium]